MKKKIALYAVTLIIGILVGWLFFHPTHKNENKHEQAVGEGQATIWTCSMHPQIRMEQPGKCPLCGMDLIPLNQNTETVDPDAIHLTNEAAALANVLTSVVTKQKPVKEVRMYGKVETDERLLQSQVAHISGRIEKLLVNFTGEGVQRGQTLALIYSPELITAQQELLETSKTKESQPEIYEAAKEKLRQWKLTESQIENIELSGNTLKTIEIVSDINGIVTDRKVNVGDYVTQGTILFSIADLSTVWLMFDANESDLPFLSVGDKIRFMVQALPGINFSGDIRFIDPVIDPVTRVSKVRLEIDNQAGKLKPGMFATGIADANLEEYKNNLIIPRSSVLWTGKRSLVYVKQTDTDEPVFKLREVELGPMLGNNYVIIGGLNEGEEIVTRGTFSVDASAQLEGKPSMMSHAENETSTEFNNQGNSARQFNYKMEQMMQTDTFNVSGNCDMCKERIEKATKSVKGVSIAVWDIDSKKIEVEYNSMETSNDTIQRAIAKAGHDTDKFKADDSTYTSLPECCKYRK
jgi:membrane fusion protein, copper/silver efflux system